MHVEGIGCRTTSETSKPNASTWWWRWKPGGDSSFLTGICWGPSPTPTRTLRLCASFRAWTFTTLRRSTSRPRATCTSKPMKVASCGRSWPGRCGRLAFRRPRARTYKRERRKDRNHHYVTDSVDDLVKERCLLFVDAAECCTRNICIDPCSPSARTDSAAFDSAEVHPILMLGVTAACIPFMPLFTPGGGTKPKKRLDPVHSM